MRRSSPGVGRRKEARRNVHSSQCPMKERSEESEESEERSEEKCPQFTESDVPASEAKRRRATAQSPSLASVFMQQSWETER